MSKRSKKQQVKIQKKRAKYPSNSEYWPTGAAPLHPILLNNKSRLLYNQTIPYYTNRRYKCKVCGKTCFFTGEDQKYQFEVRKKHIYTERARCEMCQWIWAQSKHMIHRFPIELRNGISKERALEMLSIIEEFVYLGGHEDYALVNRIKKHL